LIAASEFEYRYRYMLHGLIYAIGFSAPWDATAFQIGNHTFWLKAAAWFAEHLGMGFLSATNLVLGLAILFAVAGALLRWWGAAYLGASTVQRGSMVAGRVVADGPYRYVRNPLYLGTVLNTIALVTLMRPSGAGLTMVLITVFQLRLIAREEPFLTREIGPAYTEYCRAVPRIIPRLRSSVPHGGVRPTWGQGLASEVYVVGTALSFAALGWRYDARLVVQGVLVSVGLGLVVRAFIPNRG